MTTLSHLECSQCKRQHSPAERHNLCECGGPLLARYDLEMARRNWNREWIRTGPDSMWRWAPVLPVSTPASITSLGEGMTPLLRAPRIGAAMGASQLWIKDESQNPTGTFKARGLSCAVSMARELGIARLAMPSAGNAGSALAAYAAASRLDARIFMPADTPLANYIECKAAGADVTLVDGLIHDCGRRVAELAGNDEAWFDMSTLNEPYRIEGTKTMAYEVAEQMNWRAPDAIIYPCGGGAGLIGMWKAFEELEQLEWIPGGRPKMIAVQAEGCAPIVRAFERGVAQADPWEDASTLASGLRVPEPLGDILVLRALRESGGTAIAVSDQDMLDAGLELARHEGILPSPEGAACIAALRRLLAAGVLAADERIVVFNTGTGLKYLEAYSTRLPRQHSGEQDKLGGLITPR
ncbi:MAG TPA: threonine synthase [Bryobacteraceae bacterium]|nr:threonine synthase [Bryobacteraceae bacterium]